MISNFLSEIVDLVWGMPLVLLLMGGGVYLAIVSGFVPLVGFFHAIKLISGRFHHKGDELDRGQLSHLKALTNALSATVGLGNIAGVAVAISQGGAGAIFWMWVSALIGMNTKFFECSLAVMFRGQDYEGQVQGGPMYVIENALPKAWHFLAKVFAVCGLIGVLSLYQVNQLSAFINTEFSIPPVVVGLICGVMVAYVLMGGILRIGEVTSRLVPFMCVLYVLCCFYILIINFSSIPTMLSKIFVEAFTGKAAIGGALGAAVMEVFKIGVKRAAFSNEAGVGTAPLAHGNAKTVEPIAEGLVAMLGPFLDTIIICTMTALVILVSFPDGAPVGDSGVLLTLKAFEINLPNLGKPLLGVAVFLFSFTTMVGLANYCSKCWGYLFKGRRYFGYGTFVIFYSGTLMIGAMGESADVINLMDIGYGLMAWPNMIATIVLARKVKLELDIYFNKYFLKRN